MWEVHLYRHLDELVLKLDVFHNLVFLRLLASETTVYLVIEAFRYSISNETVS